jgi:hypothetical protein
MRVRQGPVPPIASSPPSTCRFAVISLTESGRGKRPAWYALHAESPPANARSARRVTAITRCAEAPPRR